MISILIENLAIHMFWRSHWFNCLRSQTAFTAVKPRTFLETMPSLPATRLEELFVVTTFFGMPYSIRLMLLYCVPKKKNGICSTTPLALVT